MAITTKLGKEAIKETVKDMVKKMIEHTSVEYVKENLEVVRNKVCETISENMGCSYNDAVIVVRTVF